MAGRESFAGSLENKGRAARLTGEAFSFPYDLPDDTAYAETCASIGLVFFARRMLGISPEAEYADVMERALYNGILSGMALDGKSFFYVNPLSVNPVACGERALPCLEETGEGKNNAAIYPLLYVGEPGRERNAGLDKNGIGLPGGKEVFASIPGNVRALGVFGEFFRVWK